ncbi:NADH:flavin oxidoreductase/NADH oxidase [Vibrio parahaemolyticus]|uniref:NADH:flavin oxidoreductase/NADH oxidase n=1 Tax=Vibrio parahaemolyticus TaxID=670 RepID=UPI001EFE25EC|nr:NADH:flavin oxidoreductase/NADH oxidase [Vibrio parahaemolyticus]MCG9635028.1 NADH:flavin oxidoreductase/NADH oxidase [Vibrio parahaemolyticus]
MNNVNQVLKVRGVSIRNRLGLAPMCQYCCEEGMANRWHEIHYGSRSLGMGLTIVEATAVSSIGKVTPEDLGLWNDKQVVGHSKIVSAIESMGSVPCIQLCHAGRKGSRTRPGEGDRPISIDEGGWGVLAPSEIPFAKGYTQPIMMQEDDIEEAISQFSHSAKLALEAGYKMIELHGGHGRLIHSFLSPISNKRNDTWGGSFEKRLKFTKELVKAIRLVVPDNFPLGIRLSCSDWIEGGLNISDTVRIVQELQKVGIDFIDCTSGGITRGINVLTSPGYQLEFSKEIRDKTNIITFGVGLIEDSSLVNSAINDGLCDLVLIGRASLRNSNFAVDVISELTGSAPPEQYRKAYYHYYKNEEFIPEL